MIFKSLFKDEMRGQVSYDFVGSNPTISVFEKFDFSEENKKKENKL